MAEQNTLRDQLASAFETAEAPEVVETPVVVDTPVVEQIPQETQAQAEQRARDEQGRFAPKAEPVIDKTPVIPPDDLPRPTTWKKEHMAVYDKLLNGQPLTPEESKAFLRYVGNQRENEYKTGVSTYKQEAERAKELHQALEPFMPILQRNNINPAQWLSSMGRAHYALSSGTPEQKMQAFAKLATDFGVDLGRIAGGEQQNPQTAALLQKIQQLEGTVNSVTSWKKQLDDFQTAQAIAKFQDAEKYPHFEKVRETMAQLLEAGLSTDPEQAYAKAVRMDDEVWQQETTRQSQAAAAQAASRQAVANAKANAFSVRTATPSGAPKANTKDLRAILSEQFDEQGGRV